MKKIEKCPSCVHTLEGGINSCEYKTFGKVCGCTHVSHYTNEVWEIGEKSPLEMKDFNDKIEKLRNWAIEQFEQRTPTERYIGFVSALSRTAENEVAIVALLHLANEKPKWLQMFVEETKWFRDLYTAEEFEDVVQQIARLYPVKEEKYV